MTAIHTFFEARNGAPVSSISIPVVSDGDQVATEYIGPFSGYLDSLQYLKASSGGYTDGVDFTITKESTGETIWTDTNINATEVVRPRVITQHTDGAANTTLVIREPILFVNERIKIVLAQAGATKTGTFVALVRQ